MRRFIFFLLCVMLLLPAAAPAEGTDVLRGYEKEGGWQYVTLGEYPYEADGTPRPVLWRILGIEDGQALLYSEYILDLQQVIYCDNQKDADNHNIRNIDDFTESDLYVWMNSTMLETMFPHEADRDALAETRYGKIYPLTREQYMTPAYGFPNAWDGEFKVRQGKGTPYAKTLNLFPGSKAWNISRKLYVDPDRGSSPHWVIYFKKSQYFMQLCGYDGHLSYGGYTRRDVGVRPAITVDLSQCTVLHGSGTLDDPYALATVWEVSEP